jgi:hypothetical protein
VAAATVRVLRRAGAGVGRRGGSLLLFGVLDLIYAWLMYSATPARVAGSPVYRWFAEVFPGLGGWATLWAAVGVICIYHAFHHYDRFGFVAAIGIKVVWALLSLAGWIMSDLSAVWAPIWFGLAGLVWIIAGWPEPEVTSKNE